MAKDVSSTKRIELKELAVALYDIQAIKFGEFKTKSGLTTPIYFDLRIIISYPKILSKLAKNLWELVAESTNNFEQEDGKLSRLCGVPYTALPLTTLISVEKNIPMLLKRKEIKSYGTKKLIEGEFSPGDNCIVIEDVITSGSSILETADALRSEGLNVKQAFLVIDREQNGIENLKDHEIEVKSLYKISEIMAYLRSYRKITSEVAKDVDNYLQANRAPTLKKIEGVSNVRLELAYKERVKYANNSLVSKLLNLMDEKKSNLCLALDVTEKDVITSLAELAGKYIVILKIHVDIVKDFDENFILKLKTLAEKYNFLLMEDRKFSDIGNTVTLQYKEGIYKIAEWADFITVHPMPGVTLIDSLGKIFTEIKKPRGIFLVAEMSSKGALNNKEYINAVLSMARNPHVVGFVCQSNIFSEPGLLQLTPGVKLYDKSDDFGQQYNDPQTVINMGADLAVVGRGITESCDKMLAIQKYRNRLWYAYEQRLKSFK